MSDRCLSFKENLPGGNWIECDKLLDGLLSESQKCCMYNINLNENFANSNQFCARFDSAIFSSKIVGYKAILENYAAYLNLNYGKTSSNMDSSNFWTSCKSNDITADHSTSCIDYAETESFEKKSFDLAINSAALEIVSLKVAPKTGSSTFIRYNLTNIFDLIDSYASKNLSFDSSSPKNGRDYDEMCELIMNTQNETYADSIVVECLRKLFNFIVNDSLFLVRRYAKIDQLKLSMIRSRHDDAASAKIDCFSFYQVDDELIHLSIPFLNKCFHLTLLSLKTNSTLSQSSLSRMYWESVYAPFVSTHPGNYSNSDLPLKEIRLEFLYNILGVLGITEINCIDSSTNMSNSDGSKIFAVKRITADEDASKKLKACSQNSSSTAIFLNISALNKFNRKTTWWMTNFTHLLKQPNVLLLLHSYSFYKKILHLSRADSFIKIKVQVN